MNGLLLVEIGALPPGLMASVSDFISRTLHVDVRIHAETLDPEAAFAPQRGQYDTRRLLATLETLAPTGRVVGLTEVDIFSSVFAYVFGEARLGGRVAIVSAYRLNPRIYGLGDDPERLDARMRKETLHEIGHLLGLVHCLDADCVMHPSTDPTEVDMKPAALCAACRSRATGARA